MGLKVPTGPCEGCGAEDDLVFYSVEPREMFDEPTVDFQPSDEDSGWLMEVCRSCREDLIRQEVRQCLEEWAHASRFTAAKRHEEKVGEPPILDEDD